MLNNFRYLGMVFSDPERKDLQQMCSEFLLCTISKRCIALHYLTSFMYRRDVHNFLDYVSKREAIEVQDRINNPKLGYFITNKLSFMEHFERNGFPVPRLLGYNLLDKMHIKEAETWSINDLSSPQSMKESLNHIMANGRIEDIFLKPMLGTQGVGAFRVNREQLNTTLDIERLYSSVSKNSYVYQQVVFQHPELSRLNPTSLNTMRIDTFRAPHNKAEIISALLRVGGGGNYIDAVSAGGVFVGIHLDNGYLKEKAQNFFHGSRVFGTFIANPLNGILFKGFQIPFFNEVKQTVTRAAESLPPALIGWDVAVGPAGPVLIEANCLYYGLTMSDIAYGGYRKNPVYQKALKYANMR